MGQFLNPTNISFSDEVNSDIYVDKTGLIRYTNRVINTTSKYICNSRPRRFGKSYAADMLTAYYSKGCDSRQLFNRYEISKSDNFEKYLNKSDVIHLDIQWFLTTLSETGDVHDIVGFISSCVIDELKQEFKSVNLENVKALSFALSKIYSVTGTRFVIIIDEWDVLIRDEVDNSITDGYITFLRSLFKGTEPSKYLSLAYLTGILPIKKLKTESALNDFDEFTMIHPGFLASYFGFTESEIHALCEQYDRDYNRIKQWYDGYLLAGQQIYNPRSVSRAVMNGDYISYWSDTGTYESIVPLIKSDFDGLRAAIIAMLSGDDIEVITDTFQNDVVGFSNRDDVLTLLIHLGYLAYNESTHRAFVPNDEVRLELGRAVQKTNWTEYDSFNRDSEKLLNATIDMDSDTVAGEIEKVHNTYASMISYNDENSLSSVLTIGYLSSLKYYFAPVREMPLGRGFADFIYIPRPEYRKFYPAMVVELKWNKNVSTALDQIKAKKYPEPLRTYTSNVLLVGINYDLKSKEHTCKIEKNV